MERARPQELMPQSQQSRAQDHLRPGAAVTLRARTAAQLKVHSGRLWVTPSSTARQPSADLVVHAGETLMLAAGQEAVLEGWPEARYELVPAAAARKARLPGRVGALLRALSASRRAGAPAPAPQCCCS
ncbi:DUF2917 domain-containing protein [Caldimonas thermodepolymerans]|uniref:DUF2917 domain-containing protein n=1 Tax=Caldimonas thermodepolymerans TaxID=215580 RepID=UPI00223572E6|nr:DUF2917 domain-containing protein [Caldimonas thermodepolymerans]UZG44804.1 DUF2917 domain-containing protein [Caldimonas thermodepolymerans]